MILLLILALLSFELLLRYRNPYRLFSTSFDESLHCHYDKYLGWRPSPGRQFVYFHKYLRNRKKRLYKTKWDCLLLMITRLKNLIT